MLRWCGSKKQIMLAAKFAREGKDLPGSSTFVELFLWMTPFWDAFWYLNGFRQTTGFGWARISLQEILAFLDLFEIKGIETRAEYVFYIREVDSEWMKWQADQSKKKKPSEDKNACS